MNQAPAQPEAVGRQVKVYLAVFAGLLVGTVITVALNAIHFDRMELTLAVALFIASVKAFLVAGFFMHLLSEKKAIYAILLATVFFFAGMMGLIIWGRECVPLGTEHFGSPPPRAPAPPNVR